MAPRRCGPGPGRQGKAGGSESARFTLPDEPRNLNRRTASTTSSGRRPGSIRARKVRPGSSPPTTKGTAISFPPAAATPPAPRGGRPAAPAPGGAGGAGAPPRADAPGPALLEAPGPERPVDLAHIV